MPASAEEQSDMAKCIDAILDLEEISNNAETYLASGKSIYETMTLVMPDNRVMDISGVTLEEALYYVSLGTPVLTMDADYNAVLITGYDVNNVYFYYPSSDNTVKMSLSSGEKAVAAGGSLFIGYME